MRKSQLSSRRPLAVRPDRRSGGPTANRPLPPLPDRSASAESVVQRPLRDAAPCRRVPARSLQSDRSDPRRRSAGAAGGAAGVRQAREPNADELLFSRQIAPLLSKLGCNLGTCHDAVQGKGKSDTGGRQHRSQHHSLERVDQIRSGFGRTRCGFKGSLPQPGPPMATSSPLRVRIRKDPSTTLFQSPRPLCHLVSND